MDRNDEHADGRPEASGTNPGDAPKLSAGYLPYDDERLWIGMPADRRGKRRTAKRRPPKREKERTRSEGSEPTRTSRLSRPISFGRRQVAAAIVALALPVSAFAVTGVLSRDVVLPGPQIADPSLSPVPVTIDVVGLRADRVTPKRVDLAWEVPALDGPLTYVIYRDGVAIAESNDPWFSDGDVEPQRYYYYAVATVAPDGRAASSPQLLVAVPSETGALPEGPAPAPPAPIIVVAPVSPSPTKTPSPTKSKIVWPSTDFGGGGVSPSPCPSTQAGCPGYVDPCSIDNTQPGCPGYVDPCDPPVEGCPGYTPPPAPAGLAVPWIPLVLLGSRRRRRGGSPTSPRLRWPGA
ncbi:MAG: hypothetical protein ACKOKE_01465 [Actinomycetota bacterium]